MKFCPDCESILMPKKNKKELYCRVCDKTFSIKDEKEKLEYKIGRKITRNLKSKTLVLERKTRKVITEEDRRGYYFFQST